LGDFRDRLGKEKWKKLFFQILKQIEDAGFAKGTQCVGATHIIANIAIPGTIGLIRQGIKAVMEEIEKVDPELYTELGGKITKATSDSIVYLSFLPSNKNASLSRILLPDGRLQYFSSGCHLYPCIVLIFAIRSGL
jgi:IS5 family transposase